jgi:diaminopimelate epimerase
VTNFIKYHGLGNDFVVLSPGPAAEALLAPDQARALCRRGFGVGADGVMTAGEATGAHLAMRLVNSDGSIPEMCGNGIRCFVKYAVDELGRRENPLLVATPGGIKPCHWHRGADGTVATVEVDMGAPSFERARVPMRGDGEAIDVEVPCDDRMFVATGVNTGNPHMVIFGSMAPPSDPLRVGQAALAGRDTASSRPGHSGPRDPARRPGSAERDLARTWGPRLTDHPLWTQGANVEFATALAPDHLQVAVWERGCGLTEACGTGATATAAAAVRHGLAPFGAPITVSLPGGDLAITIEPGFRTAWMAGPAVEVYRGALAAGWNG